MGKCPRKSRCAHRGEREWLPTLIVGLSALVTVAAIAIAVFFLLQNSTGKPDEITTTTTVTAEETTALAESTTVPETTTAAESTQAAVPFGVLPAGAAPDSEFILLDDVTNVFYVPVGAGDTPSDFRYRAEGVEFSVLREKDAYYALVYPESGIALKILPNSGSLNLDDALFLGADGKIGTGDDREAVFLVDQGGIGWYLKGADESYTLVQKLTPDFFADKLPFAVSTHLNEKGEFYAVDDVFVVVSEDDSKATDVVVVDTGDHTSASLLTALLVLAALNAGVAYTFALQKKEEAT
jgi:hypothetical protein